MKLVATRVKFRVRRSTATERFAFRYGEVVGPVSGRCLVRWDDLSTDWIDAGFLETCPWTEGRQVRS